MVMPPHIHRYFQTPLVFLVGWVSEKAVAVKGKNYRRNLSADPLGRLFSCNQRNNFSGYAPYALDDIVFSRFLLWRRKTSSAKEVKRNVHREQTIFSEYVRNCRICLLHCFKSECSKTATKKLGTTFSFTNWTVSPAISTKWLSIANILKTTELRYCPLWKTFPTVPKVLSLKVCSKGRITKMDSLKNTKSSLDLTKNDL